MGQKLTSEIRRLDLHQEYNDDYDHKRVRRLIRTGRLAACYKGLIEPPTRPLRFDEVVSSKSPFLPWDFGARHFDSRLYDKVVECPICLLYYPVYINYSRCCHQPICTECFLRLKRSSSSPMEPPSCPFCVRPDFGVIHVPPTFTDQYGKRSKAHLPMDDDANHVGKSLALDHPDVVLVDSIRPNWHKMVSDPAMRMGSISGRGTTRRRIVRPNSHHQSRGTVHLRADDSPYYGHRSSWPSDHESAAVMHAIRSHQ